MVPHCLLPGIGLLILVHVMGHIDNTMIRESINIWILIHFRVEGGTKVYLVMIPPIGFILRDVILILKSRDLHYMRHCKITPVFCQF
jgi:hypothetical protein